MKDYITDTYKSGKDKKSQQIDLTYETVEDMFMSELSDPESIDTLIEELRLEINRTIIQYKFSIDVEDVLPSFIKTWNLRDEK